MSAVVKCDAPGCSSTRPTDGSASAMNWLTTTAGLRKLDFCSHKCMGDWARAQPGSTTTVVDGS